jgi:hypothetical protein
VPAGDDTTRIRFAADHSFVGQPRRETPWAILAVGFAASEPSAGSFCLGSADTLAVIHKMKPKANKNSSGTIALLPSLARHIMEGERTALHLMQD